jgi:hypothetical protein
MLTVFKLKDGSEVIVPNTPVCRRCKHEVCPHCLNWCDTLLPPEETGERDACCDGSCSFERSEIDAYVDRLPESWVTASYRKEDNGTHAR